MKIVFENSLNSHFIDSINSKIDELLVNSIPYQNEKEKIFLIEKVDFDSLTTKLSTSNRNELNRSFGMTYGNYNFIEKSIRCHLIILNKELCESLLNFEEQIAVTLHELGHILNEFEVSAIEYAVYHKKMLKDFMSGNNTGKILQKEEVLFQNECYADYYAKTNGYAEQLKVSIQKYIDSGYTQNIIELEKRISELSSNNNLSCKINKIDKSLSIYY